MTREQIIDQIKNRDREFRVWDKDRKKMIYGFTPDTYYNRVPSNILQCWIMMDFTGQLDLSEYKIFEGDIIRWYGNYSRYTYTGVVIYKDGNFLFACKNSSGYYEEIPIATISGNVIGNIFENPELFEGG